MFLKMIVLSRHLLSLCQLNSLLHSTHIPNCLLQYDVYRIFLKKLVRYCENEFGWMISCETMRLSNNGDKQVGF